MNILFVLETLSSEMETLQLCAQFMGTRKRRQLSGIDICIWKPPYGNNFGWGRDSFFDFFRVNLYIFIWYYRVFILGANINAAGDIIYLVKLNKIDSIEEQSSQQVRRFWPGLLVNFLQSRVNWNPLSHALPGGNPIVETENPTGVPLRIICKYYNN